MLSGAASISINNTCQAPLGPQVNTTGSCQQSLTLDGFTGLAQASASASLTLGTNGQFSTFSFQQRVYATPLITHGTTVYPDYASSVMTAFAAFDIAGPSRPGYVELVTSGGVGHSGADDMGDATLSFCPAGPQSCIAADAHNFLNRVFATQIGGVFPTLSYSGDVWAYGEASEGTGGAGVDWSYQFRFFEADGSTPVAFSEAPEPVSFALAGLPLLWLAWRKYRSRSCE